MSGSPLRLAAISDIQGNWDALVAIAAEQRPSHIVHTGNFGFWNSGTAETTTDLAYLKLLVAFLAVLPKHLVSELNDLSLINGNSSSAPDSDLTNNFKKILREPNMLSHMDAYLAGTKQLPCPIYTIVGPLDDPVIVEKFLSGVFYVPNLYIVDHRRSYTLEGEGHSIRIYGLGGNLKVHSLFDSGKLDAEMAPGDENANGASESPSRETVDHTSELCGRKGDLWITLPQVAQLYLNAHEAKSFGKTINIFLSHLPVVKTPLLEHLAIITGADFTVSQGLHFRYPVLGNGMSFVDSMGGSAGYIENYRSKFSRLRMILGELWLAIKDDVSKILEYDPPTRQLIEIGLSLFDKIPVTISDSIDKIVKLSLEEGDAEDDENMEISRLALKKINDMYFSAYHKLWHFNLCDHLIRDELDDVLDSNGQELDPEYNVMVFSLDHKGYFRLVHCNSQGFNFLTVRNSAEEESEQIDFEDEASEGGMLSKQDESIRKTKELLNSTYKDQRASGRGRGRGKLRGSRNRRLRVS